MFSIVPLELQSGEVEVDSWSGPHTGMWKTLPGAHVGLLPPKKILEDAPLLPPFAEATALVLWSVCCLPSRLF